MEPSQFGAFVTGLVAGTGLTLIVLIHLAREWREKGRP
jgi:hypothetical protein